VVDPDGTAAAVDRALASPERFSARRRAIAAELFYNPGHAAARAAGCVYNLLSLSRPVALQARASVASYALSSFESRSDVKVLS